MRARTIINQLASGIVMVEIPSNNPLHSKRYPSKSDVRFFKAEEYDRDLKLVTEVTGGSYHKQFGANETLIDLVR